MGENNTSIESERRIATVMFADISGFTAMSEKMDPEQVTCTMNDCFCMMGECIETHGGTIDKFIGDCVMVLFGVPKALEDAPQKAVNAAIEIRNRLYKFNKEKNLSIPLNIHIGINSGPVVSGMVGSESKQDFTVMGDTVNLASRLEVASQIGQILVGPATYKATKNSFQYKTLQPITLKGKTEPVPVYELLSVRETFSRMFLDADRMISSAMVGRDNELSKLEFQIMKAIQGEGSIVNVIGEAGIGKSRLVAELKNRDVMKRVTLMEGRAISMGGNLGYHLIIDLLKNWAQITKDESEVAAFTKLESAIRTTYPEALGEILPFVATLMGVKLMGRYAERVKGIEGEALEKLILKNVRDLITKGAQRAPIVAILEDLHWTDTSSLDLLESMFRLATKERIVFINVFRPGYAETGDRLIKTIQENYPDKNTEIALQPLDEKQTDTLISNLLNIKGFPHKLKEQIVQRVGGNPYFIEEVVRSFIDEGAVVTKEGGFEVTDKLATMSIPRTINEVLMARIDRLDRKTRDLVKTASVIGRNFFYRILAEVAQTIEDMDSRLEYLEEIQLIREQKRMEELEYLFKHALAQEVAYESILLQRRKELHKSVADSIEKVFNEHLHEFYGMLAFHYSQADDQDKTEEYLIKAGEESLKSSASAEALSYYKQALDFYLRKYGDKAAPEKVVILEKNIALALFNRGKCSESIEYFDRTLSFYGFNIPKHPISIFLKFSTSFFTLLIAYYLPFFKWNKEPSNTDKEIIRMMYKKVQALSETEPVQMFIQSIYLAYLIIQLDMTKIENGTGINATPSILFSYTGISFALSRRVLNFIKKKIDPQDRRAFFYYQGSALMYECTSGNWPEEVEFDDALLNWNIGIGEFLYATMYSEWKAYLYTARGDLVLAQNAIRKIEDIGETYDNELSKVVKFVCNTCVLLKFRMYQDVSLEVDKAIKFTGNTGHKLWLINLYSVKARIQIMTGDITGADNSIKSVEEITSDIGAVPQNLGEYALSKLYFNLYSMQEALSKMDKNALPKWKKISLKAGRYSLKMAFKIALIKVETLKLMGVYYWLINKQRKAMQWWRKAIAEGQRLNDRMELSRTYYEVGKRLLEPKSKYKELDGIKAEDYLEKARVMFVEMDLQWDLDELEKLKIQMGT